jgi:hypothetical protein
VQYAYGHQSHPCSLMPILEGEQSCQGRSHSWRTVQSFRINHLHFHVPKSDTSHDVSYSGSEHNVGMKQGLVPWSDSSRDGRRGRTSRRWICRSTSAGNVPPLRSGGQPRDSIFSLCVRSPPAGAVLLASALCREGPLELQTGAGTCVELR